VRLALALPRSATALRRWALVTGVVLVLLAAATSGDLGRGVAAALAVSGLAAAAAALRRHHGEQIVPPTLTLLERQPLGPDAGLALVAAGGRRLIVGWGAAGVTLLAELTHDGPRGAP
jgi:Flagellar biosynthesis protein, FliO